MQSKAASVAAYLAQLPPERCGAIQAVREVILRNLDKGFEEGMTYGMIGFYVPHSIYPDGYHCDPKMPLPFAGLANQKNYMSVYLGTVYTPDGDAAWFHDAWAATGKKLDMGKVCIRFKRLEDLPLEVIGESIRRMPLDKWIGIYERSILTMNKAKAARAEAKKATPAAAKSAGKPSVKKAAKKTAKRATKKAAKNTSRKKSTARR